MVTVRELLQTLPDIFVYAGEGGLDKELQTISFIDAPSSVDWLSGGEVILTTAFLYKENIEMQYRFVQKLIEMGVVALGIKIGRYISEIPDSILRLANENDFPIFRISFDTVWSEIFTAFHTLHLDKKDRQSILSTEIVAFDKLFRSSTWDSEAIRSHYLKCISIPTAIVNDRYEILSENGRDALDTITRYCEKMQKQCLSGTKHTCLVTHTQQKWKISDHMLYSGERIILCSTSGHILETEVEWSIALYKKIREKNKFMQDVSTLWKNFISECLVGNSDENFLDYIRILNLQGNFYKTLLIFSGAMAAAARDELKQLLRPAIRKNNILLYCAEMESGDMILLYGRQEARGEVFELCQFSNELRTILQKVISKYSDLKVHIGKTVFYPEEIKQSYESAVTATYLGVHLFPEDALTFYEDICLIDILSKSQYDFSEIEYLNRSITSFDACKTLETFLECSNIKRAAECAFIHDNTMRYRIQKIEQTLSMDLSRPLLRTSLLLKLKLWYLSSGGIE